ncbi:MAG: MotA/TolQ/ExbB proton channel family protein [Desulfarculus sp.]|nr:MotA/TolQ/ExbB proton channel family protein [Desulfarculus sp.]
MDIATIGGVFLGVVLIFGAIILGGDLSTFINLPSIMIVVGGTLASTLITFPLRDVGLAFQMAKQVFAQRKVDPNDVVRVIITVANLSRRQGLVALSKVRTDNQIFKKALNLIADGAAEDMIRQTLHIEIEALKQRRAVAQDVFRKMGAYAPAFGMLGTLIGLIQMLRSMSTPDAIGPGMAVALITTFYGSMLSSLIFLPIAGKLKSRTNEELANLSIIFQGAMSILENNNPLLIYEKLSSFIPPRLRDAYDPARIKDDKGNG